MLEELVIGDSDRCWHSLSHQFINVFHFEKVQDLSCFSLIVANVSFDVGIGSGLSKHRVVDRRPDEVSQFPWVYLFGSTESSVRGSSYNRHALVFVEV